MIYRSNPSLARPIVLKYYWELNYCTCSDRRFCTFTCPYLEWRKIVYFAHRFYSHQFESNLQISSFLQGRRRDQNLSRSNHQPFSATIRPLRTEYRGYQNNFPQAAKEELPKIIHFTCDAQVRTVAQGTALPSTSEQGEAPKQWISSLVYLPRLCLWTHYKWGNGTKPATVVGGGEGEGRRMKKSRRLRRPADWCNSEL